MLRIYFIRHAESSMNANQENHEIVGGRENETPLTGKLNTHNGQKISLGVFSGVFIIFVDKGREQAKQLGMFMKERNVKFHKIFVSPAIRTQHTANIALKHASENGHSDENFAFEHQIR